MNSTARSARSEEVGDGCNQRTELTGIGDGNADSRRTTVSRDARLCDAVEDDGVQPSVAVIRRRWPESTASTGAI